MADADFDLKALYDALDEQRRSREKTWADVTREVNRFHTEGHPIAASTITDLKDKPVGEGDGLLQMLLWLGRTPESFIPGFPDADAERFRLREVEYKQCLRWDTKALYSALNAQRQARGCGLSGGWTNPLQTLLGPRKVLYGPIPGNSDAMC